MEEHPSFWFTLLFNIMRYTIIGGVSFVVFYVLWPTEFINNKIQDKHAKNKDFIRELLYSLQTITVFIGFSLLFLYTPLRDYSLIYSDINSYGVWWIPISILLAIILHDAFFYWMHRIMHHRRLYRKFHIIHHKSFNPCPLTSYAFNVTEAVLEACIIPLVLFMIPMQPIALILFALFAYSFNVYAHLGYEIMPKWFRKSVVFEFMVTSVHHNLHHEKFKGNYGYYFRIWDRLMGTEHPDYVKNFDKIQKKRFGTNSKKTSNNILLTIGFITLFSSSIFGQADIQGDWKDDKSKTSIQIYKEGDRYFGKLIFSENPEDQKNIERKNIIVLRDFKKSKRDFYCCGSIYQPKHDRILTGDLEVVNTNTLRVKAKYGLIRAVRIWKRRPSY